MTKRKINLEKDANALTRQFVSYRVARTHARLARQGSQILKEVSGISRVEWWVISSLHARSGERLSDIVRSSQMDKGQLSRAIKGLIEQSLVEASNAGADLRNQHLQLTNSGEALFERTIPHMIHRQAHLMSLLTEQERRVLYSALDKLAAATDPARLSDNKGRSASQPVRPTRGKVSTKQKAVGGR